MVKLVEGPTTAIVQAYKKRIDFYVVNGQHRARAWPRWTLTTRSPQVVKQQPWLPAANDAYGQLRPFTAWSLKQLAAYGSFTARDVFMKHFFGTCLDTWPGNFGPCIHETPYPIPDGYGHYNFPLGMRLREEADGHKYFDFLLPNHKLAQAQGYLTHHLDPIQWARHPLFYTRRGITYTGYQQSLATALNFGLQGQYDPAGWWYFDTTWMHDQDPHFTAFFSIHSSVYYPGGKICTRTYKSPLVELYGGDWEDAGSFPRYSPPPNLYGQKYQGWWAYSNRWNTGWADFW